MESMLKNQEPVNCQGTNDEIDLVDLFLIIWKRKMMIVACTLLLTIVGIGVSLVMPKVYEVTAILEPGKDVDGKLVESSQAIRENILGGAYNGVIAEQLNLRADEIPDFKVVIPKNTDLIKISVENSNPEIAVKILDSLLDRISEKIESQLEIEKNIIKNKLEVAIFNERLYPERIQQLSLLIKKTDKKIPNLENAKEKSISDSKGDPVALLLYLNEIQHQQDLLNRLQQKLSDLKSGKEKSAMVIANMRLELASIKGTSINKQPTIPEKPIKPKKALIVTLAFILGLMSGIMLVFVAEFMGKVRLQQKVDV